MFEGGNFNKAPSFKWAISRGCLYLELRIYLVQGALDACCGVKDCYLSEFEDPGIALNNQRVLRKSL